MIKCHRNTITVNPPFTQRIYHPRHSNCLEMKQKAGRENRLAQSQLTTQTNQQLVARLLPRGKILPAFTENDSGREDRPVRPTSGSFTAGTCPPKSKEQELNMMIRLSS